ncbi:hypothetical protein [Pseudobutyrivibrio xylanivorans]|uniref:Uncharacterized protein n=1 Tax=Pseudobutyrivibrio xylanivorans DSM 14809 TaxID=1123012 RepID=A0A1M6D8V0_PSEXY|nr:hypothetical protein [Pseudobutyrivibrio xylanivorans]SHI69581.1 hypothetical protein SAMN02745725_00891 [Pseudobutyrivibrio xylanivorans DSM 14809]
MVDFWVGENVSTSKKKILILGESHYDEKKLEGEEVTEDCTRYVMNSYFTKEYKYVFFDRISASFGFKNHGDAVVFYNKVYFGNYITHYCESHGGKVAEKMIKEHRTDYNNRLFKFINENKIDIVVCFSKRSYWSLPGRNELEDNGITYKINGSGARRSRTIHKYVYRKNLEHNGCDEILTNDLIVYGIAHPSDSFGYRPDAVYEYLKDEGVAN